MLPILCMVSDKHLYALRPFIRQFNKYWGDLVKTDVTIAGYTHPGLNLPANMRFISLGDFKDYPAQRYSESLIEALRHIESSHVIIMLEDYWLSRPVNYLVIEMLSRLAVAPEFSDVIRLDLSSDRMYAGKPVEELGSYGYLDLISTPAPSQYRISLQAGIWNKKLLLDLLIPGESPWEIEIEGTKRSAPYRVVGTRQPPIRYFIAIQNGKLNWQAEPWQVPITRLSQADQAEIQTMLQRG